VYEDVYNFRFHGRGEFFLLNLEYNAPGVWTVDFALYFRRQKRFQLLIINRLMN